MSFFRPANALMVQYAHYHRDRRNIATHLVGVPLIFMAIGILLTQPEWAVGNVLLTPAWLVWGLTSLWYLSRGNFLLGLATVVVNGLLIALAHGLASMAAQVGLAAWQLGLAIFVVGWIIQFVGHYWEGRKPAFVDDIVGLLVGPMFVVGEVLMAFGFLGQMRMAIERQAGPSR
ncbi:DUF962 domain-containing protein [Limnohabitans sp. Jir72]|uniref:Mpo1 family 2-hydroxy fatty acid dioxygenase n=1 Tax=Limnohabitans sp. Jir72 TaxID=1977909 RepID=UPI000D371588|nr:Mpo1-like protein [Limnohabitans sp. Jir72]PUE28974.1 hypothetical protein B9Z52_13815 [Limnohabitans sp. Jir72]